MIMRVFDKSFDVQFVEFEDNSKERQIHRKVTFIADGETYYYIYSGVPGQAQATVFRRSKITGKVKEVYSTFKHHPDGVYYQEIGRQLAVEHRKKNLTKS